MKKRLGTPSLFLWNQETIVGINKRIKGIAEPSPIGILSEPEKIWTESANN